MLAAAAALLSCVNTADAVTAVAARMKFNLAATSASTARGMPTDAARALALHVVDQMTPQEIASLLSGGRWTLTGPIPGYYVGNVPGIKRLGIPPLKMQDAGAGFRNTLDGTAGTTTGWPSLLCLASTFDDRLVENVAAAIGREFRGKGANVVLGPSVNVHRTAFNGRNFEYLSGEDPYLGARLTAAYVKGVQGEGVMATAKHFAFNEQETERMSESSVVDERTAWELYYPPFEAAVEAGAGAFMCSYNKVNGTWSCENSPLLKRDLKGKMGFKGFVMSDWLATHSPFALEHGLDQEQPMGIVLNGLTVALSGDSPKQAAAHILTSIYSVGLDERPGCEPPCLEELRSNVRSEEHSALALAAATQSVILLKNEGVLPLEPSKVRTIAIIGKAAVAGAVGDVSLDYYSGGGSGHTMGGPVVTPLQGITQRAARAGVQVKDLTSGDEITEEMLSDVDVAIVVVATTSTEGADRTTLALDNHADALIDKVSALKSTVVLMQTPGAVLTPWRDEVKAIANLFLGGETTGNAWASILFGDVAPSAKLPIMFPATEQDVIAPGKGTVRYSEGLLTSYRSNVLKAAFPFGHGLSYTAFEYAELKQLASCDSGKVCVSVKVTNVGSRAGQEVAQAYTHFLAPPPGTPDQVLRGFHKTKLLAPGGSEVVRFAFTARDLATYVSGSGWVPYGETEVRVGASSADIRNSLLLRLTA